MSNILLAQSGLTVLAIIAIFVFFLIYSRDPDGLRKVQYLDRTDIIIMAIITLVYAGISIINLGSFYKYENPWHGDTKNNQLVVNFTQPVKISQIDFAVAKSIGDYSVAAMEPDNKVDVILDQSWRSKYSSMSPATLAQVSKCFACFRWYSVHLNRTLPKYKKIIFKVYSGQVEITKIAFADENGKIINNYNVFDVIRNNFYNNLKANKLYDYIQFQWLSGTTYDEIYYAVSAYEYLKGKLPDVGQHPQSGMYLILIGILLFGMSAFGWRSMSYLAGILLLPLIYVFAKFLFRDRKVAISASILLMTEFMHFVMGRIAMLDSFVTMFLVLEYYFLYRYFYLRRMNVSYKIASRELLYLGVTFGIAVSCKWSGLFSVSAIIIILSYTELILVKTKNNGQVVTKILIASVLLIILPLLIYIITYMPPAKIINSGNIFKFVYSQQKLMLNLISLHNLPSNVKMPNAASWWMWPFNIVPILLYSSPFDFNKFYGTFGIIEETAAALFSNPLISVFIFFIIFHLIFDLFKRNKNSSKALFILIAILSQYLPYVFFHRATLAYYFYSIIPFLILGISYMIEKFYTLKKRWINNLINIYLLCNILLFVLYYPLLSGMPLSGNIIYLEYASIIYVSTIIAMIVVLGWVIICHKVKFFHH